MIGAQSGERVCKYCWDVVDYISDSWVKRETDGIYCVKNPEYGQGGGKGKHEAAPFLWTADYSDIEWRVLVHMVSDTHISDYFTSDQHFIRGKWRRMKTTLERHHADGYSLTIEDIPAADVPKIQAAVQHAAFGVAPHLAPIPDGKYLLSHAELDTAVTRLVSLGDRISGVRLVRACTGWGLKEAKDYVERLTGVNHG